MLAVNGLGDFLTSLGLPVEITEQLTPTLVLAWGQKLALVALTILAGRLALRLIRVVIEKAVTGSDEGRVRLLSAQRANTLSSLLNSVANYVINFIVILTVLQLFGVPTQHVLAGAGIFGLAIGFGAQNLVRDMITGFFILYEDQFGVGDVIEVAGVTGTVEEMGFRVTKIRDFDGSLHIIPNGDIQQVRNCSRGHSRVIVDVDVAYEEDIDRALTVLSDYCANFEDEVLVEGPTVLGVVALGESSVTIRMLARSKPLEHWGLERRIRLGAKKALDEAGVEIPYRRLVLVPTEATKIQHVLDSSEESNQTGQVEGADDDDGTAFVSTS